MIYFWAFWLSYIFENILGYYESSSLGWFQGTLNAPVLYSLRYIRSSGYKYRILNETAGPSVVFPVPDVINFGLAFNT